jgi:hypothetical protein
MRHVSEGTQVHSNDCTARSFSSGFSCRASMYPRLIYGVQALFPTTNTSWWHIYIVRSRRFGRNILQPVVNSPDAITKMPREFELVANEVFLISNDFIMAECDNHSKSNCQFLIYYSYRNIPHPIVKSDYHCQNDNYPDLFK